jgi:hypothetical protein
MNKKDWAEPARVAVDAGQEMSEIEPGQLISGHLDGIDDEGRVRFVAEGAEESVPVAIGVALPDASVVEAARMRRRAMVSRTSDAVSRLVLVGLVRERVSSLARDAAPGELQVNLDGETLRLEGKTKVELVCGRARIVLHQNGRVEVSGTHLLTRSRGPVRIKGATVHLN